MDLPKAFKAMQNYEPGIMKLAAAAIQQAIKETWARQQTANIFRMEAVQLVPSNQHDRKVFIRRFSRKIGRNAVLTVIKLHRQMGHPS